MKRTRVTVYLAVPMPSNECFEDDTQRSRTALYTTLDELCRLSGQLEFYIFESCSYSYSPTIQLLEGRNRNKKLLKHWFSDKVLSECEFLKISIEVPFDTVQLEMPSDFSRSQREQAYRLVTQTTYLKRVTDLLVMANICCVGSIEVSDSIVIQDGAVLSYTGIPKMNAWPLQRAVDLAQSIGWPKLQNLDLSEGWRWLTQHTHFGDGLEGHPTGRALNALSRLFEPTELDEALQLVWALVGIESLYVKGKVSIMEQVRERVQAFLGRQEAYKKRIVEMYDFRSRFMHGDLDFQGLYFWAEAHPTIERYTKDQSESVDMAVAILVATLQKLIQRDWGGLDFSYKVNDLGSDAT